MTQMLLNPPCIISVKFCRTVSAGGRGIELTRKAGKILQYTLPDHSVSQDNNSLQVPNSTGREGRAVV